jgi:hypothetical protein
VEESQRSPLPLAHLPPANAILLAWPYHESRSTFAAKLLSGDCGRHDVHDADVSCRRRHLNRPLTLEPALLPCLPRPVTQKQ